MTYTRHHYKGWTLTESDEPGYRLRWTAWKPDELRLAASTRKGLVELIKTRERQEPRAVLPARFHPFANGEVQ